MFKAIFLYLAFLLVASLLRSKRSHLRPAGGGRPGRRDGRPAPAPAPPPARVRPAARQRANPSPQASSPPRPVPGAAATVPAKSVPVPEHVPPTRMGNDLLTADNLVVGIVLSEVLGRPRAHRPWLPR